MSPIYHSAKTAADTAASPAELRDAIDATLAFAETDPVRFRALAEETLRTIRGNLAPSPEAAAPSSDLAAAQTIIDSLHFERGIAALKIPAGLSDEGAFRALNAYRRRFHPELGRDAVSEFDMGALCRLSAAVSRDISKPREIRLDPLAAESLGLPRKDQQALLNARGQVFANAVEAALVGCAYFCREGGSDIFRDRVVRCDAGAILFRNGGLCFQTAYGSDFTGSSLIGAAAACRTR